MATEPTLRHLFGEAPSAEIDVSGVIRRSRARRAPRILGAGAFGLLAVSTIAYGGFVGLSGLGATSASDSGGAPMAESSEEFSAATDGSTSKGISLCGGAFVPPPASEAGLVLSVAFPAVAEVGAASIDGTVTLTNSSDESVSATTMTAPMITLSQGDTVVWHSFPDSTETMVIDLAPGESLDFDARLAPVTCSAEDDLGGELRDELPVAPAGTYQVSASIDIVAADLTTLVGGPAQSVTLR